MKIALIEPLGVPEQTIDELSAPLKDAGHEFVYFDTKTTDPAELARRSEGAEVVMIANNPYPAEVVAGADALKMIAVAFTGIDHVGLSACHERGVEVRNCAGYSDVSVAELTLGLAIDVLRKVSAADAAVRTGKTSAGLMGDIEHLATANTHHHVAILSLGFLSHFGNSLFRTRTVVNFKERLA